MAKGNETLDDAELRASKVMCAVYGDAWSVRPRDVDGAPSGTHDFDLTDGTTTIAVEVSTIADHSTVRDSAEWSRHFPGLTTTITDLQYGWVIVVSAGGRARTTAQSLEKWLRELERRELDSVRTERWAEHVFTPEPHRPAEFRTLHAMASVGIISADRADELPAGTCVLYLVDDGYSWHPDENAYVAEFVSDQLAGPHSSDVERSEELSPTAVSSSSGSTRRATSTSFADWTADSSRAGSPTLERSMKYGSADTW